MKKCFAVLTIIIMIAGISVGCKSNSTDVKPLDVRIIGNKNCTFNFSIDEYIEKYNEYYKKDCGSKYLKKPTDSCFYEFKEVENAWSVPILTVSAENGENVRQIAVTFDWHSYSDDLYENYEKLCFYAIKTVLPNMSDEDLKKRCTKIISDGYNHPMPPDSVVPYALYRKGKIGITVSFAIGKRECLTIIPLNSSIISKYRDKGVKISSI